MLMRLITVFCLICTSVSTYADPSFVARPDVRAFIDEMVQKNHFKKSQLIELLDSVQVRPKVMQSIKKPLEKKPWHTYQLMFVTEWRIRHGVEFWNKHQDLLERAEKIYGVPASIIVATLGVETKYGQHTGEYPVIDALANIAFSDSPRAPFFRSELEQFLLLVREQRVNPRSVMGSYAGAIGQPQFMPSSYRNYAVNFSGSGQIDLSHDIADIIGSIANYYKKHGWQSHQPVAMPVSMQGGKYQLHLSNQKTLSKSELIEYGVIPPNYSVNNQKFKIIELQNYYGNEYWLGFRNFDVIKRYNPSDLYAMAVYQLSYYISVLRERLNNG